MGAAVKKKVQRRFKIRGYNLNVDALEEVLSFLSHFEDAEDEALDLLLDEIKKESLKSILDKDSVHRVVSLLLEADAAVEVNPSTSNRSALRIIDAFVIPKFCYDPIKKIFYEYVGKLPIHGDASAKAALYRNRYQLLLQRISRHQHFSKPAFDIEMMESGGCEISPVQSLIGRMGRKWIMGVISQLEDGHFYLEDLTASVEVNLSNAISL
ncbi:DNA polymerase epsilon subunit B-like [Telopea speciosissima]|uniref:DNA polymerase epsilon subunit B-like n=1 Tax=Telopea speciosissima TaxID=54955 RepID=UPI001CC4C578|nr:DNA polymerase epsilon subunit B-like [Telopea speciosissima]